MADMTSEARVVCLDRLWPDDRLAGRAAGLGSTAGGGVGEHRWLPARVGGIQVDAGRHDLVDPVEDSDAVDNVASVPGPAGTAGRAAAGRMSNSAPSAALVTLTYPGISYTPRSRASAAGREP